MLSHGQRVMFTDTRVDQDVREVLRHAVRESIPPFSRGLTDVDWWVRLREDERRRGTGDESPCCRDAERREIITTQRASPSGSAQRSALAPSMTTSCGR